MKVSIIIPVVRVDRVGRLLELIEENAGVPRSDYEIVTEIDTNGIGCPLMVDRLVKSAQYDWVMFLGDDTLPQPDFLKSAIAEAERFDKGFGLVCLNDGIHSGNLATHWMAHKHLLDFTGGYFFDPEYKHLYCDSELTEIAKELGVYRYAADSVIRHDHPSNNDRETDEFYHKAYSSRREDRATYLRRRAERTGIKNQVAIGLPVTDDRVASAFFLSAWALDLPPGTSLIIPKFSAHAGTIDKVRNDLVTEAINRNCTHILFMDTDQIYNDTDLIYRLLSHNKPIVGGKVHRRYPPFEPILHRDGTHVPDEEIEAGGLVHVDHTGAGCLLVDLDVFMALDWPWFETERDERHEVTCGEDVHFCRKAKEAGFEIFVDCDVNIDHLATLRVNGPIYEVYKALQKR